MGNTIDKAIVIHKGGGLNDYVSIEYECLKNIALKEKFKWKVLGQEVFTYKGKQIDKLKLETTKLNAGQAITQNEDFYFDITECFVSYKTKDVFDEKKVLTTILESLEKSRKEDSFANKCLTLIKEDKLFKDVDLTVSFMDYIFNHDSLPLFDSMMTNKGKPIMDVLRIIRPRLS